MIRTLLCSENYVPYHELHSFILYHLFPSNQILIVTFFTRVHWLDMRWYRFKLGFKLIFIKGQPFRMASHNLKSDIRDSFWDLDEINWSSLELYYNGNCGEYDKVTPTWTRICNSPPKKKKKKFIHNIFL